MLTFHVINVIRSIFSKYFNADLASQFNVLFSILEKGEVKLQNLDQFSMVKTKPITYQQESLVTNYTSQPISNRSRGGSSGRVQGVRTPLLR